MEKGILVKFIGFRLDLDTANYVSDHYYNASEFYRQAILKAVREDKKRRAENPNGDIHG